MYKFYMDGTLLPVAPESLDTKINNANKTFTLIDDGEINLLKTAKLSTFEFTALLPNQNYPFAVYSGGYQSAAVFLDKLEQLKISKKPFQFIVNRLRPNGTIIMNTNIKVSLEEYSIVENAKNGTDVTVKIKLKQFRDWGTKTYTVSSGGSASVTQTRSASSNSPAPTASNVQTYKIKSGDTLWNIAKTFYGNGSLCYKLATYNGIKNPNLIYAGNSLKIPAVSELG